MHVTLPSVAVPLPVGGISSIVFVFRACSCSGRYSHCSALGRHVHGCPHPLPTLTTVPTFHVPDLLLPTSRQLVCTLSKLVFVPKWTRFVWPAGVENTLFTMLELVVCSSVWPFAQWVHVHPFYRPSAPLCRVIRGVWVMFFKLLRSVWETFGRNCSVLFRFLCWQRFQLVVLFCNFINIMNTLLFVLYNLYKRMWVVNPCWNDLTSGYR